MHYNLNNINSAEEFHIENMQLLAISKFISLEVAENRDILSRACFEMQICG